jgi:hypothetical protein
VDFDSLRRALTSRSRAIVVVHPNHPTGSFLGQGELVELERLGLPLIADEVFADYPLEPDARRVSSVLAAKGVLVIGLGGLSKLVGLPQYKLGWMYLNGPWRELREASDRLEIIADSYLSANGIAQRALPELLRAGAVTRAAIAERCRENLELLKQRARHTAVTPFRVEGGWHAPLRLPDVGGEVDWALDLLTQQGVLVDPGWFFDFEQPACVVVSLLTPPAVFGEGLERLFGAVERRARG